MSSRHKYAVMEREKFYFNESYKFTQLDELDGIITDEFPGSVGAGYAGFPWSNALLRDSSSGMQQQSDKTGGLGNNLWNFQNAKHCDSCNVIVSGWVKGKKRI